MGETTTLDRPVNDVNDTEYFPPATFEESAVETSPEIEAAKNEIERTRTEMSATVDAIKAQLSPQRLVAEAKEAVTDAAMEKVEDVKDAVKEKVSDVVHGAGEIASSVVAKVSDVASSIGEKASALTDTAKEKWSDLTSGGDTSPEGNRVNGALIAAGTGAVAVAGMTGTKLKETGDLLMDTIRENPVPAALVGVGLGWLLIDAVMKQQQRNNPSIGITNPADYYATNQYGSSIANGANNYATAGNPSKNGLASVANKASDKLHETGDKIADAVSGAKDKVSDTAHDLQEKAGDLADTAKAKVSDLADTAKTKASDTAQLVQTKASEFGHAAKSGATTAVTSTKDFVVENPLAAGAIALLAGAVIGLALPSTPVENKYLGDYRDRLADQANEKATDLLGKVQNVAGEALNVAKSSLSEVKDHVQESVKTQVREQGLVAA